MVIDYTQWQSCDHEDEDEPHDQQRDLPSGLWAEAGPGEGEETMETERNDAAEADAAFSATLDEPNGTERTPEDVDAWEPCYTCGRPIEWHGGMPPGPGGWWEHVDASEGFDCSDRRGDVELAPAEPDDLDPWQE
jgi:hypothetical protein